MFECVAITLSPIVLGDDAVNYGHNSTTERIDTAADPSVLGLILVEPRLRKVAGDGAAEKVLVAVGTAEVTSTSSTSSVVEYLRVLDIRRGPTDR